MQGVLAGRYRLERQLGKGGMGSVWLAEHLALRSWVAVKLMDPAIAATPEGAERFRREAQAAASLRSAHVVQVLDYGVDGATPYLVMELLQGESLAACLEREKRLSPERTAAILTQVARALGRAHSAGIVHRDLKPDNIFLVREDDQELVKILDFGIAKTPQAKFGGMDTRTGVTMGTPYYMSPEQMEGKRAVDFRTDLWAMAVIACECMSGVRPFDGSTFGELLLNICARPIAAPSTHGLQLRGFDEWFARATSRDPEQRFTSAQELASTLKDVVAHARASAGATQLAPPAGLTPTLLGTGTQHGYAPAVTGAPGFSPAAAPLAPTITTDAPIVLPRQSALPLIALGVTLFAGAVAATLLLLRPHSDAAADALTGAAPSESGVAPRPSAAPLPPPLALEPTTDSPSTLAVPSSQHAPAKPLATNPAAPAVTLTPPLTTPPLITPPAAPPATAPPATQAARCFADPFSGLIRPAGARQPAGAPVFACRQDPFTGKYKRL